MSFRRFKRMGAKHKRTLSDKISRALSEARELMDEQKWVEARRLLTALDRQFPERDEILTLLALTHYQLKEHAAHLILCIRLSQLRPNDSERRFALANSSLTDGRTVLAYLTFRQILELWPGHEDAAKVRELLDVFESKIDLVLSAMGLADDNSCELAALHEEAQTLLAAGEYQKGIAKAEELLKRKPDYSPAYYNISLMHYFNGEVSKALAAAERALTIDPDDFHALAILSRCLLASGREEEACGQVERLKRVGSADLVRWVRQAEACAALGDDPGVVDALASAEATGLSEKAFNGYRLYHLAAAAQLRMGHEEQARKLWEKCLQVAPSETRALENLEDLDGPIHKRNGPWSFHFTHWIAPPIIEDLMNRPPHRSSRGERDRASTSRQFLRKYPHLQHVLPILFDRGDPAGRDFAVNLAGWAETPEMIAMLRQFALGQKGRDRLRIKALRIAHRLEGSDPGIVRFWSQGGWRESRLYPTEIYYGVEDDLSPAATELYLESYEALSDGDGVRSEKLLKQALELAPDSPQLLNNLAASYVLQGRVKESEALARQILEEHPDYLFARANIANRLIDQGKYDEAREMLKPLAEWDRMQVSEAAALYNSYIYLHFQRGELETAREWFEMLEGLAPNDFHLDRWRRVLDLGRLSD